MAGSFKLRINIDSAPSLAVFAPEYSDLTDAEVEDRLREGAHEHAINSLSVHVRNISEAVAWIREQLATEGASK